MRIKDASEVHPKALELLTYICCCLSLACLFVVFIVFMTLKNVLPDQFIIHRNLVGALFTAQLLYVTGIDATSNKIVCRIIAVTLHYFYTVSFCWMLIEGINLCFVLIKVFNNNDRFPYYYLFGWGFPVIIVGTSVSIACNGYGTDNYCWLSTDIIWFFIVPAMAIILVNIGILVSVIKILVQASNNLPKVKKSSVLKMRLRTIRSGIKGAIILLPILGTTWIFGIVLVNSSLIVFEYIFAIFNGLQGVFIFIFYCVLNSEVQGAVRLKWMQASNSVSPLFSNVKVPRPMSRAKVENRKLKSVNIHIEDLETDNIKPGNVAQIAVQDIEENKSERPEVFVVSENLNQPEIKPTYSSTNSKFAQEPNTAVRLKRMQTTSKNSLLPNKIQNDMETPLKKKHRVRHKKPWRF